MNVLGFVSDKQYPFIPEYLLTSDGVVDWNGKVFEGKVTVLFDEPISVGSHEWVGITHNGKPEVFNLSEMSKWKFTEAKNSVDNIDYKLPPEKLLAVITASANLIGFDLKNMIDHIVSNSKPGEKLIDVFNRLRKSHS